MLLTTRFQPRLQAASRCRTRAAGRSAILRVVAFKNGDDEQTTQQQELARAKVTFQLPMHVEWGQEVALVGAGDSLGNWDVERCIPMNWHDGDMWTAEAELPTNTSIEYKYIVRASEGEVKAVVEWQPCNNLELQAEQLELTIRDAWEGQQHEVLPGTLPVPTPPAPEPQPADTPETLVTAQAEEASAATGGEALTLVAAAAETEQVPQPTAAAPAPAEKPESPAAAVAAASPVVRSNGRRSTSSRTANGSKPTGGNSSRSKIVAAAVTEAPVKQAAAAPEAPAVKYGSLSTSELRDVCQERGVSPKGQRRDLLARLQQLLQPGRKA